MSALPLGMGKLALVSPVPIDDALARQIAELGEVQYLIAPNLYHHFYLAAASERYPKAKLLAPGALRAKRPALQIHAALEQHVPDQLAAEVEVVPIEGAPGAGEFAFFHRAARTLVVTDLVFHIVRPQGLFANLLLFAVGCHERLGSTRSWRFFVKDRGAAAASIERLLALPFQTLVMAHGEVVREDARVRLAEALSWFRPRRPALLPSG